MEDERKTKKQLIAELNALRQEQIEQTRVSQEKFTKAFLQNSIPMGITTLKEGRFVEVNDAFLRLMGRKLDEVIGHTSREIGFITEEQREYFFAELSKRGRIENLEMEVKTKDGVLRYGLFNAIMMSINTENYLLTVMVDSTKLRRAEEVLRDSEERYKALFDRSLDCVYIHDFAGNFLDANNAALNLLGYKREELPSLNFATLLSNEQIPLALPALQEVMDTGYQKNVVGFRLKRKNGDDVHVEVISAVILREGKPYAIQGIARDITNRKQAEAQKAILEAQNRQLQKSESLGRMAGAIAHHFNNLLGVVIGNLEMAMDDLPNDAEPVNRLNASMQAAGKAAQMSGLMLTYLGQSFDDSETLDLSEACRRSQPILRAIMPGNVVLENDLPSPGPIISANTNQIQQVLTNLVTNAWESVGESRGAIHLRVRKVSPVEIPAMHRHPGDWKPKGNAYACLEVTDTGCGIEDKDIEKIFDPFFSTKFTGRGMGLAVVMGIVKAHSGVITVESEPGRGTTFRVFFPVEFGEVLRQPEKADMPTAIAEGGTVLLVEDDEMMRVMAATMLMRLGFSVIAAKDGVEALELFRQHQNEIKFVLSDLTMPRMNGWETLTALRELKPAIPVILASGYDKAHVMEGDHPELPQAFLGKPYRIKGLIDAISQALINSKN